MDWIVAHWQDLLMATEGVIAAVIGIALLIPGNSPEKELQAVLDFLKKFSVKPSESSDKS